MTHEQIARRHEAAIDALPRVHPLAQYPVPDAIAALLRAYDSLAGVHLLNMPDVTVGSAFYLKSMHEGLVWALRWFSPFSASCAPVQSKDGVVLDTAGAFVLEASKYALIASFYTAWSFGQYEVEAGLDPPFVRFIASPPDRAKGQHYTFADAVAVDERQGRSKSKRSSRSPGHTAIPEYRLVRGHIEFVDLAATLNTAYPPSRGDSASTLATRLFPEDLAIHGFTVRALNRVWSALYRWAWCAMNAYIFEWQEGTPQELCMPTQTIDERSLCSILSSTSGVDTDTVGAILELLWYAGAKMPDVFLTPLIRIGGVVTFSAHAILLSHHQRNLMKRLTRDPLYRDDAATLIGNQARAFLKQLGDALQDHGYRYYLMRPVPVGDVDLLAWNPRCPTQVLVVEGKAVLPADSIAEVTAANDAIHKGARQIAAAVESLRSMSLDSKQRIWRGIAWEDVSSYFPIVITPATEPAATYDHRQIPAISFEAMTLRLKKWDWQAPESLWKTLRDRPWLAGMTWSRTEYFSESLCGVRFDLPGGQL